jgi:hypothetical protein
VAGSVRFGLLVRNLFDHGFQTPSGQTLTLGRQVRVGVAVFQSDRWVAAADADLMSARTATTRWRRASVGAERWWGRRRFALRGGLGVNTLGNVNPVGTLGASVAVRAAFFIDTHVAVGHPEATEAWSISGRFAF